MSSKHPKAVTLLIILGFLLMVCSLILLGEFYSTDIALRDQQTGIIGMMMMVFSIASFTATVLFTDEV